MAKKRDPQNESPPSADAAAVPPAAPAPAAPLDALPAFIRKHEDAAARRGEERGEQIVVVAISHPAAGEAPGIHAGRDGGIRMSRGAPGAVYSDGSKHTAP